MSDDKRRWRHGVNKLTNASFSQLVVQYERLVYTVCFQLVRDAAAAEDLTQETFLSAYLHRDAIPPGYERQWLCRVATNKAKDYLQSAYQRHTLLPGEDNIPPGLSPPAEETVLRRSAAAEIRDLILHMPAGGKDTGGGGPGAGPAGKDHPYTAVPGQADASGGIGKEWER